MNGLWIVFGALIIADAICYVHGHKSYFFVAKTDYEHHIINELRGEVDEAEEQK